MNASPKIPSTARVILLGALLIYSSSIIAQNVGIGTTTPLYPLTLKTPDGYGLVQDNTHVRIGTAVVGDSHGFIGTFTDHMLIIGAGEQNPGAIYINPNTNLGIGALPSTAKLHIWTSNSTQNLLEIENTFNVPALYIDKSANVGIGTATPLAKLDLIGIGANPTIAGSSSTGILRIGNSPLASVDIGKMAEYPHSGWIQSGNESLYPDPLCLQPVGGTVGIGTSNPWGSAALDIVSNDKGFLPPRLNVAERNGIGAPVPGLMIWCKDCGVYGQLQVFNGTFWANMTGSPAIEWPAIGVRDGGGIIAYIFQPGDPGYVSGEVHGLITVPTENQFPSTSWGCIGTNLPGAEGTALGTGNQNTLDIINGCSSQGIAAQLCYNLVLNGFSDWYLPSKVEMNILWLHRNAIGDDFYPGFYWTSSESNDNNSWTQDFEDGSQDAQLKNFNFYARAIRKF